MCTAKYLRSISWINQDMVNCGQLNHFSTNSWVDQDIVYCGQVKYFSTNSGIDQDMVYCGQLQISSSSSCSISSCRSAVVGAGGRRESLGTW